VNLRRIRAMLRKDLRDVVRDARILVAIIMPLAIGIIYNVTFPEDATPTATMVVAGDTSSAMPALVAAAAGDALRVTIEPVADEVAARARVLVDEDADVALVIPAGFDVALAAGDRPAITVVLPPSPSLGGSLLASLVDPVARAMAGADLPVVVLIDRAPVVAEDLPVIERLGLRNWAMALSFLLLVSIVALFAVPILLAEEAEKKTLDALVMIASLLEVTVAKALAGVVLVAINSVLLIAVTQMPIARPLVLAAGVAGLAVVLIGAGLLLAGIFRTVAQLNTWSGLVLSALLAPAFVADMPVPEWVQRVAILFPSAAGMRLVMEGLAPEQLFPSLLLPAAVLLVWTGIFYGLVIWRLSRRAA